ncbi:alpha/beta hydrolase [Paenibacillus sp. Marseille-Q7038]
MNYALSLEYPFPIAIKQLNRGLAYLVNHGEEYDLDMTNIVIGGGSAGGNLAGLLVNIQTNPEYADVIDESAVINPEYIKATIFEGALFDNSKYGVTGSAIIDWCFTHLGRIYLETNELKTDNKTVTPSNVTDHVTENFPPSFISDGNTGTFDKQAFAINES